MTHRSLFNIVLKIFGLLLLKNTIEILFELINSILYLANRYGNLRSQSADVNLTGLFAIIVVLVLYFTLLFQPFFKTNNIIDALKLDQGFENEVDTELKPETFTINTSNSNVLIIAIIATGSFILVEEIPKFAWDY